jgi:hypothetical protein
MTTDNSQIPNLTPEMQETITENELLRDVNYAVHESGHVCAAASRNLPVSAEIGVVVTEIGRAGAMTWHRGGTADDDLFILACGIATSRQFGLGEAGLLRDIRRIDVIAAALSDPESAKQRASEEAELFVKDNNMIIKMAYALDQNKKLNEKTTQQIYTGEIDVEVPPEFHAALDLVSKWIWTRVASSEEQVAARAV